MCRIPAVLVLLVLVPALAILSGCMGTGPGQAGSKPGPSAAGALPGVTIISPANGAVLPAGDIIVTVQVTNFTLVPKYGQPYVAGEGHLLYSMGMGVPEKAGSASSVAPISLTATTETSYTWRDVPAGTYTFTVELANNDHYPFPRPIFSTVTVRVTGELPATATR